MQPEVASFARLTFSRGQHPRSLGFAVTGFSWIVRFQLFARGCYVPAFVSASDSYSGRHARGRSRFTAVGPEREMTEVMRRRLADRRGRPRFEIVGQLWGTLETVVGLPLRDVSLGGALVSSTVPLERDSEHHVTIMCEGVHAPTKVRVRHISPRLDEQGRTAYAIGLEFVTLGPVLRAQIEAWLNAAGGAAVGV